MILTLSFGAGHVRAAEAIAKEMRETRRDMEIVLVDALDRCRLLFRAFYVWPYLAMIRFAPSLWKRIFESRRDRVAENTTPKWFWRFGCPRTFRAVAGFRPDVIIACEVGAVELAEIMVQRGTVNCPVVAVITDFDTEPIWAKTVVTAYAVPSERVRDQLIDWGRGDAAIEICGIPVDGAFAASPAERGVDGAEGRPMILLMGGGSGPTRMSEVASELLRLKADARIVALPARDDHSRAKLEAINSANTGKPLRIVGWVDNVAELMTSATLLITKPGGLTVSEAAAARLPMVLFDAIPGPEDHNACRVVDAGAATKATSPEEAAAIAKSLLEDHAKLAGMRDACGRIAKPDAAARVVELVSQVLGESAASEEFDIAA